MLYLAARYAGVRYYGCGKARRSGLACADYADLLTAACADCADGDGTTIGGHNKWQYQAINMRMGVQHMGRGEDATIGWGGHNNWRTQQMAIPCNQYADGGATYGT
eukprot:2719955-Pyramimonas_sp.AAC.1